MMRANPITRRIDLFVVIPLMNRDWVMMTAIKRGINRAPINKVGTERNSKNVEL
jgi:hypothetical protein